MAKDKYDLEIDQIREAVSGGQDFKHVIYRHWSHMEVLKIFALFQYCTPDGKHNHNNPQYGCLTQIKLGDFEAATPELTKMIRTDDRIAQTPTEIKSFDELEVYAEYQRLMDRTIRQPIPEPVSTPELEPELVGV